MLGMNLGPTGCRLGCGVRRGLSMKDKRWRGRAGWDQTETKADTKAQSGTNSHLAPVSSERGHQPFTEHL